MVGKDVEDKSEFSFRPKSCDTITENTISQVSLLSKRRKPKREKKSKVCPDCQETFRDNYNMRRHRKFDKDYCPYILEPQKMKKKD
jgi:hypothetical protein